MKNKDTIKLSNDRVLQVEGQTIIAWASIGAMEREDAGQIIATFHADPRYPLISRTEAVRLTGIPRATLGFAVRRGDVEEIRMGDQHSMLTIDSVLRYAANWPHPTRTPEEEEE